MSINVVVNNDLKAARESHKPGIALMLVGWARGKNFYADHVSRQGWADDAHKIQDLFLSGKRQEAVAAVPDELVDELSLVGPRERIRERATAWKASKATMLLLSGDSNAIKVAAEAFL